jgi:hypothetical protein
LRRVREAWVVLIRAEAVAVGNGVHVLERARNARDTLRAVCLFIVVLVAERAADALLHVTPLLTLEPVDNRSLAPHLAPGERVYSTTTGHCDCDSVLGSRKERQAPRSLDSEIAKLRKKGWSAAKIAKWAATQGPRAEKPTAVENRSRELEAWQQFLDAAPSIGVLLHWYRGPLSGRIEVERVENVERKAVDDAFLAGMHYDVIYRISPTSP